MYLVVRTVNNFVFCYKKFPLKLLLLLLLFIIVIILDILDVCAGEILPNYYLCAQILVSFY